MAGRLRVDDSSRRLRTLPAHHRDDSAACRMRRGYARTAAPEHRQQNTTEETPVSRTRSSRATARLIAASVTLGAVITITAMVVALLFAPGAGPGHLPAGPPAPAERGPRVTVTSSPSAAQPDGYSHDRDLDDRRLNDAVRIRWAARRG